HAVSKVSRWRPLWLWVPAACGIVWAVGAGPPAAAAGFGHGPAGTASALPRGLTGPAGPAPGGGGRRRRAARPVPLAPNPRRAGGWRAGGGWGRCKRGQGGGVCAACDGELSRGWRRRADSRRRGGRGPARGGRRLGVDEATGGSAVLSWRDAGGGVLLTGAVE